MLFLSHYFLFVLVLFTLQECLHYCSVWFEKPLYTVSGQNVDLRINCHYVIKLVSFLYEILDIQNFRHLNNFRFISDTIHSYVRSTQLCCVKQLLSVAS